MIRRRVTKAQLLERVRDLETVGRQMFSDLARCVRADRADGGYLGRVYRLARGGAADKAPVFSALPDGADAGFADMVHPEDAEALFQAIRDHMDSKTPAYNAQYRLKTGGVWRAYRECGAVSVRDGAGAPLLLAADLFDVADAKAAPAAACGLEADAVDALTGIKSRAAMIECLEAAAAKADFLREPLSVVMFDIDDFRNFNEALGSEAGDEALRYVARIIQHNVRESDTAGRYGGEEFLVLFPRTDVGAAEAVAERIRCEIAMNEFSLSIPITVSGGVMQYAGESLEGLVSGVDEALRAAKAGGKNRIVARPPLTLQTRR